MSARKLDVRLFGDDLNCPCLMPEYYRFPHNYISHVGVMKSHEFSVSCVMQLYTGIVKVYGVGFLNNFFCCFLLENLKTH